MTFGERLLNARSELKLSQSAVGTACGVSQATYSRWESDDAAIPGADKVFLLARTLGVRAQWLAEGVPPIIGRVEDALVSSLRTPALQELLRLHAAYLARVEAFLPSDLLDLLMPPTAATREQFEEKLRSAVDRLQREPGRS